LNFLDKKFAVLLLCISALCANCDVFAQGGIIKLGLLTDMSGPYTDIDGPGGEEAIKMAIADFGGTIAGKKIELIVFDHQNKTDLAASKAREWIDRDGVNVLFGGGASAANLAMAKIAADKKVPFIVNGAGSTRLTNEDCTPYTVHYAYDTMAQAKVTGQAVVKEGGKAWYFLALDTAFGSSMVEDATDVIKKNGGTVVGSTKHPASVSDFSSYMIQAQASKAQILGLADAGTDSVNAIKSANEFGITGQMKLAGMLIFINDIHSIGLNKTKGMYVADSWYWDLNSETRAWSQRFFKKMKKMPSSVQAAQYSATTQYLKAVEVAGTVDGTAVMKRLKKIKISDIYTKDGYIRDDGRMIHSMYLMQVKKPEESKYPWDYYKVLQKIPGEESFTSKAESKCSVWK
jgi:branched-chain amino acid transport system substrate-binding protein